MKMELRNNTVVLDGYINAVGRDSRVIRTVGKNFVEQVLPETFDKAIQKNKDIRLLYNHNEDKNLGSTSTGELNLKEDAIGLRAHCVISDPEVIEEAKKGNLKGWSFGFRTLDEEWEDYKDGVQRRYLKDIDLEEVSILTLTPAYFGTSVEVRNESPKETRNIEMEKVEIIEDPEQVPEETKEEEITIFRNVTQEIEVIKMKGGKL